jgi:hypothetical protein
MRIPALSLGSNRSEFYSIDNDRNAPADISAITATDAARPFNGPSSFDRF